MHNKHTKTTVILEKLAAGLDVALVSDAGLPLISDPGDLLVGLVIEAGYAVVPIPGANAALTALIASGLTPQPFLFYGFLPRQKNQLKAELSTLMQQPATMIFYESPHRLKETLTVMHSILGNRQVVIARELTKMFEEFIRGTMGEVIQYLTEVKGEVVLIVAGNTAPPIIDVWWENLSLTDHVARYLTEGMKPNMAIKQVALDLQRPRQDVYKEYHNDEQ